MQPLLPGNVRRLVMLAGVIAIVTVAWGFALPRLSSTPAFQRPMQDLEDRGIAPEALFYTEHPRTFR